MAQKVGQQTRIGTSVPGLNSIKAPSLSKEAKLRLRWIDYYQDCGNAALTCRHFGISRSLFYKWKRRFDSLGLEGLASRSQRPRNIRQPTTPISTMDTIKHLRKTNPELSKYKLATILKRDYGIKTSASTVGRVISRYELFYSKPVKPKKHPQRTAGIKRQRKPKDFTVSHPGELIEVDVKHLPNLGVKRYALTAIDVITKQAAVHVASTISSRQAVIAWEKAVKVLGMPKAVPG